MIMSAKRISVLEYVVAFGSKKAPNRSIGLRTLRHLERKNGVVVVKMFFGQLRFLDSTNNPLLNELIS